MEKFKNYSLIYIEKILELSLTAYKIFCDAFKLKTLRNNKYGADSEEARNFIFSYVIFAIILGGCTIAIASFYANGLNQYFPITINIINYLKCIAFLCFTVGFVIRYAFSNQSWSDGSKAQMLVHKISAFFWTVGAFCTLFSQFLIPNQ